MNRFRILFRHLLTCLACTLAAPALAQDMHLADGLAIQAVESGDLTYQVIPEYDEKQKVVAGWDGDKLAYFITTTKLPPGWTKGGEYLGRLAADLQRLGETVALGRQGTYVSKGQLAGTFLEIRTKNREADTWRTQFAHHLTDGKQAFLLMVQNTGNADTTLERSFAVLQSAAKPLTPVPGAEQASEETPWFGNWKAATDLPDGLKLEFTLQLEPSSNFIVEAVAGGKTVWKATGTWWIQKDQFHWAYYDSSPPLPKERREDVDTMLPSAQGHLVLRSNRTGTEQTYRRQ